MKRLKAALISVCCAALITAVSCTKPVMPEPDAEFTTHADYDEWARDVGYPGGELRALGFEGLYMDAYETRPCSPGYASGRIVVGDSRCVQMGIYAQRAGADAYAVFAVWGGHYAQEEPYLPTDAFYRAVEDCFKTQIAEKGRCELYFFATINDCDPSGEGNAGRMLDAVRCAERLAGMECAKNGRVCSPKITFVGVAGSANTLQSGAVEECNALLKAELEKSDALRGARFVTVQEITGGYVGFINDGLHYDDAVLKALADYIVK